MLGLGDIEFVVEDGVARRVLVDVGGAMANPLPRHEDRQLHMVLDLAHLERRGVAVPHEIVDQPAVLADLLGAAAVAHARGLHDGGIVAHVVDHSDEAVIEHRQDLEQDLLQGGSDRPQRGLRAAARLVDFSLLVGGEGHFSLSSLARTLWQRGGNAMRCVEDGVHTGAATICTRNRAPETATPAPIRRNPCWSHAFMVATSAMTMPRICSEAVPITKPNV